MSEPIPADLWIGGKIPRRLVPDLCRAICEQHIGVEWEDGWFQPETADDLLSHLRDDGLLCFHDNEANYGEFADLEGFLVDAGIAFRRKTEPCWQFNASVVEFRPGGDPVRFESDVDGQPVVSLKDFTAVVAAVDEATNTADGRAALELLRRLRNLQELVHKQMPQLPPPLRRFEIVD